MPLLAANQNRQPDQYQLAGAYCRAIKGQAGFRFASGLRCTEPALRRFAKLLLSGGGDFDRPFSRSGPWAAGEVIGQDRWEISLIRQPARRAAGIGICRGLQAMNVALGGSLSGSAKSVSIGGKHSFTEHNKAPAMG